MNSILEWLLGMEQGRFGGEAPWRLQFVADYGSYTWLVILLAAAAMAYLVIRSYRREGDVPMRSKVLLMTIRLAVVALVLVILLRPAMVFRFTRTLFSSVIVLVDDSKSMSFTDRYADPNSSKTLASSLGVKAGELEKMSRKDIMVKALDRPDGALSGLAKDHPLVFMRYSTSQPGKEPYTRQFALSDRTQADKVKSPTTAPANWGETLKPLSAEGFETNASAAVYEAMERVKGQLGQRVAAIVHLGDGQMTVMNAGNRLNDARRYASESGVQIYTVMVGDPTPPKDVAVTALQAPPEVRNGSTAEFTVTLAHRNLDGQQVTLRLLRRKSGQNDWEPTSAVRTVKLQGEGESGGHSKGVQTVPVQLDLSDKDTGVYRFKAVVDVLPEEQNRDNNSAEATVRVTEKKIRILFITADAGKEFLFLMNYLLRQKDMYQVSVWQQNIDPDVTQFGSEGMKIRQLPRTRRDLMGDPNDPKGHPGYDVVMLYDPEPTAGGFDKEFVKILGEFVSRGGGLCFLAGNKHTDQTLRRIEGHEMLSDLLPVVPGSNTLDITERIGDRTPQAWPVQITSYGTEHPLMRLGETEKDTEGYWGVLPGIYWSHSVTKIKPGARVLAMNSNPMRVTDRNEREPLIAVQTVGKGGRVVYVGTDETWRWRSLADSYFYERFWSNMVRYLATLMARNVVITTGGDHFSVGERINVSAEVYDEKNDYQPLAAETYTVDLVDMQNPEKVQPLVLKKVEGKPGQFQGTLTAVHQGHFRVTAMRDDPKNDEKVASKEIEIAPPEAELARTEADPSAMKTLATRPENFLPISDVDQLSALIPPGRLTAVNDVNQELWDKPLSVILIVLLLGIEWILRKKHNMA